ncbi:MAG: DUF4416 family protein [SAR324 cluster bacterium]|nr:DUF4416 family protein [SAR324 cluster bacterium]
MYGKLITGILYSDKSLLEQSLEMYAAETKGIQRRSQSHLFDETDYYGTEMSSELYRQLISFSGIITLEEVIRWKKFADRVEDEFRLRGNRQVNVDPGYLDFHKVVLLSAKPGGHKIYLGHQVWADMVLFKKKGEYQAFAWTFPDLRGHKYDDWFLQVRADFKKELKANESDTFDSVY